MKRYRLKYQKGIELRFISHLDIIRLFERAFRRANISLAYSQGYNPRQRIAYGPPLALGYTSDAEYLDFYLAEETRETKECLTEKLSSALPPGIRLSQLKELPLPIPALTAQIEAGTYAVTLSHPIASDTPLIQPVVIRENPKHGKRSFDIRPMLKWLHIEGEVVKMMVQTNPSGTLKPEEVITALGSPAPIQLIHRTALFMKRDNKLIDPIA